MLFAPDVSFHAPEEQSDVVGMQRLVDGSHIVSAPQSEACTGQTVAAVSPVPRQQQRRVRVLNDAAPHVDDAPLLAKHILLTLSRAGKSGPPFVPYDAHPNPAPAPFVATIAVCTP